MHKIYLLIIANFVCFYSYAGGIITQPIYTKSNDISSIVKAEILSKNEIKRSKSCLDGQILGQPSRYRYTCKLISNLAGNPIKDLTFIAEFEMETYAFYDDSCKEIEHFWINSVNTGIEAEVEVGEEIIFYLDEFINDFNIIACERSLELENQIFIEYFEYFKNFERISKKSNQIEGFGITKNNELVVYLPLENNFYIIDADFKIKTYKIEKYYKLNIYKPHKIIIKKKKIVVYYAGKKVFEYDIIGLKD